MTGVMPIDKPKGFTSFDVVAKMRGITKTKKIGHCGTLDPMATGVLLLFLGGATKAVSLLPEEDKRYTATIKLGTVTDTGDITGAVLAQNQSAVTLADFAAAAKSFVGEISQLPPMYSAVKVGGKPLYKAARAGIEVERQTRQITIYSLDIISFDEENQTAVIDVMCSKGTYIRTLAEDIGSALGVGATLSELRRTMAAGFNVDECYSFEDIEKLSGEGKMESALTTVDRLFKDYPKIVLSKRDKELYKNGVLLDLAKRKWSYIPGDIAIYDEDERLLGISFMDMENNRLSLKKLLNLYE